MGYRASGSYFCQVYCGLGFKIDGMGANELRIGNLYENYEGKICSWGCDDFAMLWKNQGLEVDELIRNFIPSTKEELLKLGFDSDGVILLGIDLRCYYLQVTPSGECLVWDQEKDEFCFLTIKKYVHEIQNLYFTLTGIELTYGKE